MLSNLSRLAVVSFPLLMVALIGIAIYVQVTSSTLSLPISTGTAVLTILLPLFSVANILYTPILTRLTASSTFQQLLVPALHILQGGLVVVIATLAAQGFVPSHIVNCALEGNWQQLWQHRDGRAIERIQNTFDCCGFNSIKDRAWPRQDPKQCAAIYQRTTSCGAPWRAHMQRASALQFAIAVLVGIIQLAHLVYLRRRGGRDYMARDFKNHSQRVEAGDNGRLIEEPYHDDEEEGVSVDQDPPPSALPPARAAQSDAPHRVEPSSLGGNEANEWRSSGCRFDINLKVTL
ncbi:hypothetical protein GQX73_g5551 [Xylaria multiplex]|uniref:Tetraspanin Tsp3 n=1 Tax=Xylaria multiplex TaxID=323545 RepID=A0A7C8N6V6_9PEZI|nr:hypothetical protein GQX73_g5551 [Xylaria multiplex]